MSATILERSYSIHGVDLIVRAQDPGVIAAMDLRLRDFAISPAAGELTRLGRTGSRMRFEFVEGTTDGFCSGDSRAVYDTPYGSLYYQEHTDTLHGVLSDVSLHCELSKDRATFTCESFAARSLYLATHPLATICLMELLERHSLFSLHAACLARRDGEGVLLAGPSGAGKSTLALALVRAGMDFVSDDVVFLTRPRNGTPVRALGFSDALGITEHFALRFSYLNGLVDEPPLDGFPKRLRRIDDLFGVPALPFCEPCALVFTTVAPELPSQVVPLHASEALLKLVPDVLLTEPRATQHHLQAIAALLDQVACYELRSGRNFDRAVTLVRELV